MAGSTHGDPNLAHHFQDLQQQNDAAKLGMWLFLTTEVLLFAGLFCAYGVYRANHPEVFAYGSQFLSIPLGTVNTVVLLLSSFTVAMGVRSASLGRRNETSIYLVLTLVGAAAFMGIKAVEYTSKFSHGTEWGLHYQPQSEREAGYDPAPHGHAEGDHAEGEGDHAEGEGDHAEGEGDHAEGEGDHAEEDAVDPEVAALLERQTSATTPWADKQPLRQGSLIQPPAEAPAGLEREEGPAASPAKLHDVHWFFGIYFILTGTHGLHVVIGAIAIVWVLIRNMRGEFDAHYNTPVDLVGLYWHLVDLIWIFLFPLLYLINVQGGVTHG